MSQLYALVTKKVNAILGCMKKSAASRAKDIFLLLLLCHSKATPGLLSLVLGSPVQEKQETTRESSREAARRMEGLEYLSNQNRLRPGAV